MTTGRRGTTTAPPNAAYAGQVVRFPDPVRAARHPHGVRMNETGHPDFSPYARAAAEIADPPEGFGGDELRLTDLVSANAAQHAAGHELWAGLPPVATPHGWVWHHVAGSRRMELIPADVKALLRHHAGLTTAEADHDKRGTRPLQETRPVHLTVPRDVAVTERQVADAEERLGHRLPGAYRTFLKAAGGSAPRGVALDPGLGLLVDQPFFTLRTLHEEPAFDDLVYVNKCLRDHLTKDHLGVAFVQGGILAVKVRGEELGTVWFCAYDDAHDRDGLDVAQRAAELLRPCGADFDDFLLRLAGNPPELDTVAKLMVDGGFARAVPLEG
jgi:hypothetical protein